MTTWCRCCQRENVRFYPLQGRVCWPCLRVQNALQQYWRAWRARQLQRIGGALA